MSNYKTHVKFNLMLGLPLSVALGIYLMHPSWIFVTLFALSFVYTSFYMGPDMDLAKSIHLFSLRGILTLPFRSYSRVFHHRGISHSILLGTLTRVMWLSLWFLCFSYLMNFFLGWKLISPLVFWQSYNPHLFYMIAGIFVADLFHLVLDMKKA